MADFTGNTIIVRKEAIRLGLPRYFTGKQCKNGHIAEPDMSGRECKQCGADISHRGKNAIYCSSTCKKKAGYIRNADAQKARCRSYRNKDPEYHRARCGLRTT